MSPKFIGTYCIIAFLTFPFYLKSLILPQFHNHIYFISTLAKPNDQRSVRKLKTFSMLVHCSTNSSYPVQLWNQLCIFESITINYDLVNSLLIYFDGVQDNRGHSVLISRFLVNAMHSGRSPYGWDFNIIVILICVICFKIRSNPK